MKYFSCLCSWNHCFFVPLRELRMQCPRGCTCFHFICVWRVKVEVSICAWKSAFLKVTKTFIPRREVRKQARWGPIDFLMVYCHWSLVNWKWSFNFSLVIHQKNSKKKPFIVRMDGWTGHQKSPLIFLKFKYVNK